MKNSAYTFLIQTFLIYLIIIVFGCDKAKAIEDIKKKAIVQTTIETFEPSIDTVDYNLLMLALSNNDKSKRWPVKNLPYPQPGAILPHNRIIAFYGNLYSKRMGVLGELPKEAMLKKLNNEVARWQAADPKIKAIPALHYIAITAQGSHGKTNLYRLRMPFHQIDTILDWAKTIDALVILDVQVGHSSVKSEVATLEKYLKLSNVHLGIDPEYSMKNGEIPGTKIGTFNSGDINDAIFFLANIVRKNNLPPKILVVHRFTQKMVTGYKEIKIIPEVQVVMNMDGFGNKILKKTTYQAYIFREPVQFTGFKIFYKNDTKSNPKGLYTPFELLQFTPKPIYIQYQ
jgi:hypothetical protein